MQPCRVLIVDDEPQVQRLLSRVLGASGFVAITAHTVEDALKKLGSEPIDAVILDVQMPDPSGISKSGLGFLQYLRLTPEFLALPVLIFTGAELNAEQAECAKRCQATVFSKSPSCQPLVDHLKLSFPTSQSAE